MPGDKLQVFAVIRLDSLGGLGTENVDLQQRVSVKQILPTQSEAEAEVERLNVLNADKGALYFWQATRFYPGGRSSLHVSGAETPSAG